MKENVAQMTAKAGPNWARWRVAMILAADPIGLDVLSAVRQTRDQ